jgi:N6-L-threonylcarbamoyladenine synthase
MPDFILAIDTSCDETAVAVTNGTVVLSNIVSSQAQLHKEFGGVFPTVAKQAHKERIAPTVELAVKRAGITFEDLKAIAVTQGPGLAPALEVGISYAKELAEKVKLPLIPVNHIEGHILSVLARPKTEQDKEQKIQLPSLAVIISGGHTEFVIVKEIGHYERVGWTVDDAAGEALDKFGRMVDLGYPAGPVVEEFAKFGDAKKYQFPLPMTTTGDYLMSFSGMKTAARRKVEELSAEGALSKQQVFDLCASFQYGVFRAITYKLNKFLQHYLVAYPDKPLFGVWLGGGVAANATLRRMLRQTLKPFHLELSVPYSKKLCGDNAAMIGVVAGFLYTRQQWAADLSSIERIPNLHIN